MEGLEPGAVAGVRFGGMVRAGVIQVGRARVRTVGADRDILRGPTVISAILLAHCRGWVMAHKYGRLAIVTAEGRVMHERMGWAEENMHFVIIEDPGTKCV